MPFGQNTRLDIIIGAKDHTKAAVKSAQTGIGNLGTTIKGMMGVWLGYQGAKKFFDFTIGEAMRSEKVYKSLATVLNATGQSWNRIEGNVRSFTKSMQRMTIYGDEETAEMLQLLISYNMDLEDAQKAFIAAADLSAAKMIDIRTAVDLLGKASVGYTGTLSRYGIILDETLSREE